jgi:hypothetical protein
MTIKQFAFLAGGAIIAYLAYKLPLPFFITWPLAIFSALLGFGLAFVPVEERPMDVWILSFLKNTYNPTLFIWQQHISETKKPPTINPIPMAVHPVAAIKPQTGDIHATPQETRSAVVTQRPDFISVALNSFFARISSFFSRQQQSFSGMGNHARTPSGPATMISTHKETTLLDNLKIALNKQQEANRKIPASSHAAPVEAGRMPIANQSEFEIQQEARDISPETKVHIQDEPSRIKKLEDEILSLSSNLAAQKENQHIDALKHQLETLLAEKTHMSEELEKLKKTTSTQRSGPVYSAKIPSSSTVHFASPAPQSNSGVPRLTTFQNVATGIIKDSNGNMLPGILVTIKDQEGVPLRALKTNKLGQFAASTPLQPGEYIIEIEDPRNQFAFEKAKIVINNTILPAVEIIAKSQKEISRAKLAMDIFGTKI